MNYFDYKPAAQKANLTNEQIMLLEKLMHDEYPHDQMLAELHVLRACMALARGDISFDSIFNDDKIETEKTCVLAESKNKYSTH